MPRSGGSPPWPCSPGSAIGGVGGPLVGRLSEVATNDNANFLPPSAESTSVSKLVGRTTDTQTLPYLVVVERPSGLTPADLAGRPGATSPASPA